MVECVGLEPADSADEAITAAMHQISVSAASRARPDGVSVAGAVAAGRARVEVEHNGIHGSVSEKALDLLEEFLVFGR